MPGHPRHRQSEVGTHPTHIQPPPEPRQVVDIQNCSDEGMGMMMSYCPTEEAHYPKHSIQPIAGDAPNAVAVLPVP